jgi:hypothetical protein
MPVFDQLVKEKWLTENKQDNEIKDLIKAYFEITNKNEDRISINNILIFKNSHKVLKTISKTKFYEILTDDFKLVQINSGERLWMGIKYKAQP